MSQHRHLAAIMFTDIVGYTTIMGKDECKAMGLLHKSREVQKRLVEEFEGNWVKEMGDGVMCSFKSASDAIYCALEIQDQIYQHQDLKLRIGIHLGEVLIEDGDVFSDGVNIASRLQSIAEPGGIYISDSVQKAIRGQTDIHTAFLGELQLKNVDYGVKTYALRGQGLPPVINGAAKRLSGRVWAEVKRRNLPRAGLAYVSLAGILLSLIPWVPTIEYLRQLITGILAFGFIMAMILAWNFERSPQGFIRISSKKSWENPYSSRQKKPLTSNMMVAALMLLLLLINAFTIVDIDHGKVMADRLDQSVAVLPFYNLSNDPEQVHFADGIQEDILTQLAKSKNLEVKSRTSTLQYRNKENKTISEIGAELGVDHILEGSVRKIGNKVRITAQLINVQSDSHVWSEAYNRELTDELSISQELASIIAGIIANRLIGFESPSVSNGRVAAPPLTIGFKLIR